MKNYKYAFKLCLPLVFSYFFVGIAYGILANQAGYSVLWTGFSALFVYAGSMQIVMISLITSGVSLVTAAIMTFFINARHIFYGIGFIERFRKMGRKYPFMILTLTDETYSVLCSAVYPEDVDQEKVDFYVALTCYLFWAASCCVGAVAGELFASSLAGIEFSATAFFITVVVNQWMDFKSKIPVIAAVLSSILFIAFLGTENFILPALSVSLITLIIMREKIMLKEGGVYGSK